MSTGKLRWRDMVNPLKWRSFVYGYFLKWVYPEHRMEQYFLRKSTEECQPCIKAGHCLKCGCDIQAKMRVPSETCTDGFWGPYLSKAEYEKEKEKWGISIIPHYKN